MDFFDELGAKLSETGKKAKEKTNNLMDTAKVTGQINDLNKEIRTLHTQLGELYYKTCGDAPQPPMDELCAKIKTCEDSIVEARNTLQRLKNVLICPQCSHENATDACFCNNCGAPLPAFDFPAPEPQAKICPQCGSQLDADACFCNNCGAKLS